MNVDQLSKPERMLKLKDVIQQVGYGHTAIYARVKAGTFPAPIKLGYSSRWLESEIQEWIAKQVDSARAGSTRGIDSSGLQGAH